MNNYIMVSSPTVQSDLNTKTDYVVYIPLATKDTYGSVKIGDGLKIDYGVISLDKTLFDDKLNINQGVENANKLLYVNSEGFVDLKHPDEIQYDNKNVFPEIGNNKLIYVDLSDNSLWIYRDDVYSQINSDVYINSNNWYTIEDETRRKKIQEFNFTTDFDITTPDENKKSTIGLSKTLKSTLNGAYVGVDFDRDSGDLKFNPIIGVADTVNLPFNELKEYVDDKFSGASEPLTYETYSDMISDLNLKSSTEIKRGKDILVVQTGVPDVWVAYVEDINTPYTYVDDDTFINELLINGTVQVGYFKLAYLETQKINLDEYAKKQELENKQDKLTAGDNITIDENNVISATGGSGGLNIADLPKFTNKIYINMSKVSSANGEFIIPIVESGNFVVDWGDGTTNEYTEVTSEISHAYGDASFAGWIYIYGDWNGVNHSYTSVGSGTKSAITRIIYDTNIKSIPTSAFENNANLYYAELKGDVVINNKAFMQSGLCNVIFSPNAKIFIYSQAFRGTKIRDIVLPSYKPTDYASFSIDESAFRDCSDLVKVELPTKFGYLRATAFQDCKSLRYISTIVCSNIGLNAFKNCTNLTELTFDDFDSSTDYYTQSAFEGCTNLKTINFNSTKPAYVSSATFPETVLQLFVPTQSLYTYKTNTNWTTYADKIYPKGGNYSETITIPASSWDASAKTVTVEAVGSTTEDRNIITWNVSKDGVQVENTYGLKCTTQGTMSLTFSCETIPTEDVEVSVRYILTNY